MHRLSFWSKTWQLTFNVSKCFHLGITRKKTPVDFKYSLDGKFISKVPSTTYESYLAVLRRSRVTHILPSYALNWSMLAAYGIPTRNAMSIKVAMLQRRAAPSRFVYNDYSCFSHVSPMLDALGWDSPEHHRFANQMCMFYKVRMIYKGHVAISLPAKVLRNTRVSRCRNCAPSHQLGTSNDTYKFSFYPGTMKSWNTLPISVIPELLSEFKAIIASM